jgi:hypothetical protein
MIKLKSLKKKLKKLESSLQKDANKLAKLQRKVESALRAESAHTKSVAGVNGGSKPRKPAAPPAKKKRMLTAEGRAKLASLMRARWEAKRAVAASSGEGHHFQG